ncbi:Predicted Zn-dependent protease [Clostridium gasigenes]|uniref:Predicted Zn-dependent protease n=1 Tax=Clostridium gasigenes TaxID=94869 RepID=A0A1H0VWG5_9CLOT|nr:Predicted Zn-dependent protease [Clostridium gasigenes]
MIHEGIAENFATSMFGEDMVGPWVSKTDKETLNDYIKPIIKDGLNVTGMDNITAYLYGDEMAEMQGYFPIGLPYCAGYACGYYMIKHYLKKTGKSIEEATVTPASEITKVIEDFWSE